MDVEPYQLNDVIRHTATLVRLEELEGHARAAEASRSVRVRRVYILYAPFAQALYPFKSRGFGGEIGLIVYRYIQDTPKKLCTSCWKLQEIGSDFHISEN